MSGVVPRNKTIQAQSALALSVSVALHALVIFLVSRVPWTGPAAEDSTRVNITWIEAYRPAARSADMPARPDLGPRPAPEPATRTLIEPKDVVPPAPSLDESVAEAPAEESSPPSQDTSTPPVTPRATQAPTAAAEEPQRTALESLPNDIDWEAERQRAVAMVMEDLERAERYSTFSVDDLFPAPPPEEPGGPPPGQSVFESPSGAGRGPALLQTGRSRTRLGRWLSEICNDLSGGGIGLFGIASICTDPRPSADYFGHLRPAYMDKMPVCEGVQAARPLPDEGGIEEYETIKCRLVAKDELPGLP